MLILQNKYMVGVNITYFAIEGRVSTTSLGTFGRTRFWTLLINSCAILEVPRGSVGEGNGTPLQYSCLENPMDGGAWKAAVHGAAKSRAQQNDFTFTFHFHGIGEGNGNPLQCSCLENPRDGGAWWAAVSGVAQSRTRLKRLSSSSSRGLVMSVRSSLKWNGTQYLKFSWFLIAIFSFILDG